MTVEDIDHRFTYHAPGPQQRAKYESIRQNAKSLALLLNLACPEGREKSLAFTALEEAVMWANASVARDVPLDACNMNTEPMGRDHR